jgi:hypothetical protein
VARKPSDIVSPNLRIREELRRRLEKAAKQNDVSINREMINRLEDSFDLKARIGLEALYEHLKTLIQRVERAAIERPNLQTGLIATSEALLAQLDRPVSEWDPAAIAVATAEVKTAISNIDTQQRVELRQFV